MTVFVPFISWGKLFQALIVEGKKELKKRLVRARIDRIWFRFLGCRGYYRQQVGAQDQTRNQGEPINYLLKYN